MAVFLAERGKVDIFGGILFKAFIMDAADGESGVFGAEWGEEFGDESWFDFVVAIDKADVVAGGFFQTGVSCGGLTLVFLMNDFDAGVFFGVSVGDFFRAVGGAVVDEDDFKILVGLVNN